MKKFLEILLYVQTMNSETIEPSHDAKLLNTYCT